MQLLKTKGADFSIVEYQKKIIAEDEVLEISRKLGLRPKDFVRKSERDFKENNLIECLEDDHRMTQAMVEYPKIIERPIFIVGEKAVIARPPEKIFEILKGELKTAMINGGFKNLTSFKKNRLKLDEVQK